MNNIITIARDNSSKKKGSGTNAVLVLLKDLGDFQDKLLACMEAQDIEENRSKVENCFEKVDEVAKVLLDMAEAGIRSRRNNLMESEDDMELAGDAGVDILDEVPSDINSASVSTVNTVNTVNAPVSPQLPR